MGFGLALAQGVIGAIGGAGQGIADQALLEQKQQMEALRDQRLSALKTEQYKTELQAKTDAANAQEAKERGEVGSFFKDTNAPGTPAATYTDTLGDEATGEAAGSETRPAAPASTKDQASYQYQEALKTGNKGIIDAARNRMKDIQDAEDKQAKAGLDERKVDLDERRTAADEKRADAYIKRALGDGASTDPAKIREVKDLADMAFSGDVQKAVAYVYGTRDKPRSEAVLQVAGQLQKGDLTLNTEDAMSRAEKMVDALRAKDSSSRGGVSAGPRPSVGAPKGVVDSNRASGKIESAPSGGIARPVSQADFDALPSGSLYVNPADGKLYTKK